MASRQDFAPGTLQPEMPSVPAANDLNGRPDDNDDEKEQRGFVEGRERSDHDR